MKKIMVEMKKRCDVAAADADVYDAIQNEVMKSFFGDNYYDHIGMDDEVEEAYNETSSIRADYVQRIDEIE